MMAGNFSRKLKKGSGFASRANKTNDFKPAD